MTATITRAYTRPGAIGGAADSAFQRASSSPPTITPGSGTAFPLRLSPKGRYLEDQNGVPFYIAGDSPQAVPYNGSTTDSQTIITNRVGHGFNTLWWIALGGPYDNGRADWSTADSIRMFSVDNTGAVADVTTVQETYLQRLDTMVAQATAAGLHLIISVMDTDDAGQSSLNPGILTMRNNSTSKMYALGKMFAQRYGKYKNITWLHGVDFQTYTNATDKGLAQALANGLADYTPWAIQTAELPYGGGVNANRSTLIADSTWFSAAPNLTLSWVYSHFPAYDAFYADYATTTGATATIRVPSFFGEGNYEGDVGTTRKMLRHQHWWAALAGGCGQLYGNHTVWGLSTGWASNLDTVGVTDFAAMATFIQNKAWWLFVPARSGRTGDTGLLTSGYGTYDNSNSASLDTNTYVTAVLTSDARAGYAYIPDASSASPVVDMSKFAGASVVCRKFDPTNASYATIGTFSNSGTHTFSGLGTNSLGDGDWCLVMES